MQRQDPIHVGGHPALEFVNTVNDPGKSRMDDAVPDWEALGIWAKAADWEGLNRYERVSRSLSEEMCQKQMELLHPLRELGFRVFSALAQGLPASEADTSMLQTRIQQAISRAGLARVPDLTGLRWQPSEEPSVSLPDTVALQFEDLLRSQGLARLRECGRCTWLFIDRGRGRGRKWCDMQRCGNREKSKKFRERHN
jgi:predicted RNA-binding Zn ribbon-like protein